MVPLSCRSSKLLLALVLLGVAFSLWIASGRYVLESHSQSVELLMDYQSLKDYARINGSDLSLVLKKFRQMGVTALAVDERSRESLMDSGLARLATYNDILDLQFSGQITCPVEPNPDRVYFVAKNDEVAQEICRGAKNTLGANRALVWPGAKNAGGSVVEIAADLRTVSSMGLGLSEAEIADLVKTYNYRIWVRPWNSTTVSESYCRYMIRRAGSLPGVQGVIFGGIRNEALGYPHHLEAVADSFRQTDLLLGYVELAPKVQLKGIQTLCRALTDRVVRVLAVPPAQQARMDPEAVASMYSLAARERNIRLLYVRPYLDSVDTVEMGEANSMLFNRLLLSLNQNLSLTPSTFGSNSPGSLLGFFDSQVCLSVLWVFISMGVAGALSLLIRRLAPWNGRWWILLVLGFAAITGLCSLTGIMLVQWRLAVALLAVTVMPIWGLVSLSPLFQRAENCRGFWNALLNGWTSLAVAALFAVCGGLFVIGLLPDISFMLGIDVFRGVKLHGLLVPLAVMLVWIIEQQKRGGLTGFVRILNRNVRVWHLLVFVILAALAVFYLVRTGNTGGDLVVSESERAIRRWLDDFLGVRPRFKEFLLGNPALILIPVLSSLRWKGLVPFALLAAAVGMASVSDTYAHIHTPLMVSWYRTLLGVVIGGSIGSLLALLCYCLKRLYLRIIALP